MCYLPLAVPGHGTALELPLAADVRNRIRGFATEFSKRLPSKTTRDSYIVLHVHGLA